MALPSVPEDVVERCQRAAMLDPGPRGMTSYVHRVLLTASADPAFQRHMLSVLLEAGVLKPYDGGLAAAWLDLYTIEAES